MLDTTTNIMERKAAGYLESRLTARDRGRAGAPDLAAIRAIEKRVILWSIVSGTMSGAIIGGFEIFVRQGLLNGADDLDWQTLWPYWLGLYAVIGVVSAIEILFLYWNALAGIARVATAAGLPGEAQPIVAGLARAALEFPNPEQRVHGIDPYARVPGWRRTLANLAYRAKVGLSSFVLRMLLRRIVGRALIRGVIPLLALPLFAAWNAFITWRVMREARIRALGPGMVETLAEALASARDPEATASILMHGVAELIQRGADAHPNVVLLMSRLAEQAGDPDLDIKLDWQRARERLRELEEDDRRRALKVLTRATVIGSGVRTSQRQLLEDAHEAAGQRFDEQALVRARRRFLTAE